MLEILKKLLTFAQSCLTVIAPQNVEIRTVAKSLPKLAQSPSNILLMRKLHSVYLCSGGIVGTMNGTITNCYSKGNVASHSYGLAASGGITGWLRSKTITNCYSTGDIVTTSSDYQNPVFVDGATFYHGGTAYSGGIAGLRENGIITNCAAINSSISTSFIPRLDIPTVPGELYSGCILGCPNMDDGMATSTVFNNFALNSMDATGAAFNMAAANCGVTKTDAQLKTRSTYSDPVNGNGLGGLGWTFGNDDANPWKMPPSGGYPILYWQ